MQVAASLPRQTVLIGHGTFDGRAAKFNLRGPDVAAEGSLGSERADAAVHDDALGILAAGTNATLSYGPDGERRGEGMRVFVWGFAPKPRMLVFGAIDFAAAVARIGRFLGYHVTVCDARGVFATPQRFPGAEPGFDDVDKSAHGLIEVPVAEDLGLDGGPLYDPLGNYRRVAGDWNDWGGEPRHATVATRTVTPTEVPAATQSATGVTPPAQ